MMANGYKKSVINMKNGYGRNICAILEEKNGQPYLIYKKEKDTDVYAYTKDEEYIKGVPEGEKYRFAGIFMEEIMAVLAGTPEKNIENDMTCLVGYRNGKCRMKPFLKEKNEKAEQEITDKEVNREAYESKVSEEVKKTSDVMTEYENLKKQSSAEENFRKIMELFTKEISELKDKNILSKEDVMYIENENANIKTNKVFEECVPITPFEESSYDWAMVSMEDMWKTDVKKCSAVLNDMSMLSEIKYHHLALGRNKDDGHFVFAVPEKFSEADKKHAKELGFKDFWFCCREKSPFGYWVMDI